MIHFVQQFPFGPDSDEHFLNNFFCNRKGAGKPVDIITQLLMPVIEKTGESSFISCCNFLQQDFLIIWKFKQQAVLTDELQSNLKNTD